MSFSYKDCLFECNMKKKIMIGFKKKKVYLTKDSLVFCNVKNGFYYKGSV